MVKEKYLIDVILTAYKRIDIIDLQIKSLLNQSIKPNKIYVWFNNSDSNKIDSKYKDSVQIIDAGENFGVWARFSFALNLQSEYIAIFDDDTIPGSNWFKNCIETIKEFNGLMGTRGLKFHSKNAYHEYDEFGWTNPNSQTEQVDIVGHSWFFKSELIYQFWSEKTRMPRSKNSGEDIHFSYSIQKIGLNTFVPPHPVNDLSYWGSQPDMGIKIGDDRNAISNNASSLLKFEREYKFYINKGFKIISSDSKSFSPRSKKKLGIKVILRYFYLMLIYRFRFLNNIFQRIFSLLRKK